MEKERLPKQAFKYKPRGKQYIGRPRSKRWAVEETDNLLFHEQNNNNKKKKNI